MRRITTVSIDNDLSPRDAGIALWSTSNETTSRINVILRVFIEQLAGDSVLDNLFLDLRAQLFVRDIVGVL